MPCSLQTRIILEIAATTACDADTVLFNDYVAAGGPDVTPYIGTSLPWEEKRGAADSVDWLDRFEAIDDWCKSSDDRIGRLRALCGLALLGLVNAVES